MAVRLATPDRFVRVMVRGLEHKFEFDQVQDVGVHVHDDFAIGIGPDGVSIGIADETFCFEWSTFLSRLLGANR